MTLFRSKVLTTVYDNIRKSENDLRQYRACRLSNEMKVLLISDPTTDQAAAALSVKYGTFTFILFPSFVTIEERGTDRFFLIRVFIMFKKIIKTCFLF